MKIDTHGLKMTGLRKASGRTENYPAGSELSVQITYNKATGEVLASYHISSGYSHWVEYNDEDIVIVCYTRHHLKMQILADIIASKLAYATSKQWKLC